MENEIWKDIIGYESIYQISNLGRVKNIIKDRIFKTTNKNRSPYKNVTLYKNKRPKPHYIHRLVGIAFIPNPENKLIINHKNGIKYDNRLDNLEWMHHWENIRHACRIGLMHGKAYEVNKLQLLLEKIRLEKLIENNIC